MFRAPLCPSSGAQGYYKVVAACGISCCGFQVVEGYVSGLQDATASANRTHDPQLQTRSNRGLYCRFYCLLNMFRGTIMPIIRSSRVLYSGCCLWYFLSSTPDQQLENHSTKYHRQQPLYNTLELLMMGIVVPDTCWANNKICNKNLCCI